MQFLAIFQPPNPKLWVPNAVFCYFSAAKLEIDATDTMPAPQISDMAIFFHKVVKFWSSLVNSLGGVLRRGGLKYPP